MVVKKYQMVAAVTARGVKLNRMALWMMRVSSAYDGEVRFQGSYFRYRGRRGGGRSGKMNGYELHGGNALEGMEREII